MGEIGALVRINKRRGYYKNPRATFKGDSTHAALTRKKIPWLEDIRANFKYTDKYTNNGFLEMLVNTRWLIL